MTCIVGIRNKYGVWIGADSCGASQGWEKTVRADKKVFRIVQEDTKETMLIGFTTSFRMGQLLQYSLVLPPRKPEVDVFHYLCSDFMDAVRKCLKDGGYCNVNNGVDTGGTWLLGYAGRLFLIEDDYQVCESAKGIEACGCGGSFALGCLFGLPVDMAPAQKIFTALAAASNFSAGVCAPYNVEYLPKLFHPSSDREPDKKS